ncbi:MAG TPA: ABC transporter ATP-binding protein [Firmicutes bacterium]|nr:ABC transporter ATP-binding protein [Candidatus Fermentithermobacillaceae bacterium]
MSDVILELVQIEKSFGDVRVLNGIDLTVRKGEFITLLGPSGCGKTTTLRIIAGLETPDRGRVFLAGKDVTDLEPNKRNVNTVFQNYALFPHMNVEANIAYSLKLKKTDKQTIAKTVKEALELVQLSGYEKRMPDELSGGQKQRVAIARAIVNQPAVLLLDEPLGALDLQLRHQMQIELKRLQKRLGVTFIYITHDQEEALNMSDRIAVMRDGKFEQIGTPAEVYDRPKTSYVARFVGSANLLQGKAYNAGDSIIRLETPYGFGLVSTRGAKIRDGQAITVAVRRESVTLVAGETADGSGLRAIVKEKHYAGGVLQIILSLSDGSEFVSSKQGLDSPLKAGDHVLITWLPEQGVIVDLEEA